MQFFALMLAASSLFAGNAVNAAPSNDLVARQVGGLVCNIDRLGIVAALAATQQTLKKLSTDVAANATAASEVQSAEHAISGAQGAIGVIAKALLEGKTAPADARDEVRGNLTAARDALVALDSKDSASSDDLKQALAELAVAAVAGKGVVDNCK
ncbi:hypothetical protein BD413DRAFT_492283 [Trametes elegans]|nr:hypothetical protein BD413DRAFT_492283 [Trametes elegans]